MTTHLSRAALAALLPALLGFACGAEGTPPPEGATEVRLERVASGLDFPLYLTAPADDPRLFVVEKGGRIRVVKDGALLERPFLDLSALVSRGGEQGLLGLAFHPRYAENGRFFVNYTDRAGDTRIAEYRVSGHPDAADPAGRALLAVDQPYANHNGGHLAFGPDGYLYAGLGDGGSGGDPHGHGQRRDELLGSILRLDVDGGAPYAIPPDNPWAGVAGARGELWDSGLRNPWRFSFDRETGDLYVADVGQSAREEVNVSPAASGRGRGANYGWNVMEGTTCYAGDSCDRTGLVPPVLDYGRGDGCSVTGGYVYRGRAIPALRGLYFYSDFCGGWVRSFRYEGGRAADPREWPSLDTGGNVPSFGEDAEGELYVLTASGEVYRIAPAGDR